MSDLKKEIKKAIGETASHQEKVWQSLQQPRRKHKMPIFITGALAIVAGLWLLLLQQPVEQEPATSMEIGVKMQSKNGIPYTMLQHEEQKPAYIQNDFAISYAKTVEEYKELSALFQMPIIEEIDFTNNDIIFALYTADGCGRVIDQLTKADNTIQVHLALPPQLRMQKEIACTTIATPNIAVIEVEKQNVQHATFVEGKTTTNTAFNNLNLDNQVYHFDLLLNPDTIHSIQITDLVNNKPITVERDRIKNDIAHLASAATPLPGISNMTKPDYEIFVQTIFNQSQKIYLWTSPESDTITIMSSRDPQQQQIYTIPKSSVQFIQSYLN